MLAHVRSPLERAMWKRRGWDERDGVAALYGVVEPPPGLRALLPDRSRLVHPEEQPDLALLPLDRRRGEDLLTCRALRFRAALAGLALGLAGALLLAADARRARRRPPQA